MWNTSFLVRSHGLSLQHAGLLAGVICGISAGIGGLFSGWLSDRLSRRHPHWQLSIPVLGHLTALGALIPYLLWSDSVLIRIGDVPIPTAMLWCALYAFFAVWWVAPSYNLVTQLVPPGRRMECHGPANHHQHPARSRCRSAARRPVQRPAALPVYGQESLRYALMLVSLPVLGSVLLLVRTASHAARTEYRHAVTVS
jgi:hypothetical protein